MEYIAHKADDGREQSVKNHLEDVAKLAEKYAAGFLGSAAYTGGLRTTSENIRWLSRSG